MPEQSPPSGFPEAPEPPEAVKWIRWIIHHFQQEGHVIRRAPVAVLLSGAILGGAAFLYLRAGFQTQIEDLNSHAGVLQATIQFQDERISALTTQVANHSVAAPKKAGETTGKPQNDYVCATRVPGNTPGEYGILIEFGVLKKATTGFAAYVGLSGHYSLVEHWGGQPLRTDLQTAYGIYTDTMEHKGKTSYTVRFDSPNITPERSEYIFFVSKQQLTIEHVLFLSNVYLLGDPMAEGKANKEAATFGPCPRR